MTSDFPKPLLPIDDRPAIDYIVDKLIEIDNAEIFVLTNLKFEKHFQAWKTERKLLRVEIVAERSSSEREKLGAIRALSELAPPLPSDDYVIVAGDNTFTASLREMVAFYNQVRKSVVAIFDSESPDQVRTGSSVTLDKDMRIVSFEEKPVRPTSRIVGACIYILPYATLLRTGEYLSEGGKSDEPGNFIAWLCRRETVYGFRLGGLLWDIGSLEEYERTQREFSKFLASESRERS